ncbi:MAG TPA: AAA family ATPase [Candidatus Paceibacterota bacterium]
MYLKNIELSGFKSFAKKAGFEFNTPISAIVGPNGSGKSNVAEAFRFVLGEQSMKSMRGKRGEDLIWNGSNEVARAGLASVKVTFDNSHKVFDLDFPEVSVERVVHRDGVNEYKISGSTVRLKDILELLASAHIGVSGHHIISQGEADKIVSASPKDRKAMVEDALGLKIYQYKLLESEKKLEQTAENEKQVEALRREIAPHLKFLKKQMEKVEKTEGLRKELVRLGKEYLKREESELEKIRASVGPLGKKVPTRSKDELIRELGKVEGLIMAEERFANSEGNSNVSLKEVESLYQEISLWHEAKKILERIRTFINEKSGSRVSSDLSELKKKKNELEEAIKFAEIHSQSEALKERETIFKSELQELARIAGPEVLRYKDFETSGTANPELKRSIERLKIHVEDDSSAEGDEMLKEYRETSERDEFLSRELGDLEKSSASLKDLIKDLDKQLATEFEIGLKNINTEFEKLFSKMFGGGDAELMLVREEEGEEGLDIRVSLPRKKVKSLMMLSGGERALTSIALIFSISAVNPPPFIILDETDAALDEANSRKYGDLVEILSEHSQLILITHNRETMSRAGVIYGVTMGSNGISKVLSIAFEEAVEVAK